MHPPLPAKGIMMTLTPLGGPPSTEKQTMTTLIAEIAKNSTEHVRVNLDEFRGTHVVDVRVFTAYGDRAEPGPTKKGVSLRVDRLPELIAGLQKAEAAARAQGLIGAEPAA